MTETRKRRNTLAGLLPEMKAAAAEPSRPEIPEPTAKVSAPEPVAQPAAAKPAPRARKAESVIAHATFADYERKEARLRQDQLDNLEALAKRIKRAKSPGGERITDNTLIRVAVDLLLAHQAELHGSTEEELRRSVSL